MLEFSEYLTSDIRILLYIFYSDETFNNYNLKIARELNIPTTTVNTYLSKMHDKGFLSKKGIGKTICYELLPDGELEVKKFLHWLIKDYTKLIKK